MPIGLKIVTYIILVKLSEVIMKMPIVILFLLITFDVFGNELNVIKANIYPTKSIDIAKRSVNDIRDYYTGKRKTLNACIPKQGFEFDKNFVELIKHKTINEVRVEYYDDYNILLNLSFVESKTTVALNVSLKNNECNEFIFYEAERWVDPKLK
jgi:hypothetical protein